MDADLGCGMGHTPESVEGSTQAIPSYSTPIPRNMSDRAIDFGSTTAASSYLPCTPPTSTSDFSPRIGQVYQSTLQIRDVSRSPSGYDVEDILKKNTKITDSLLSFVGVVALSRLETLSRDIRQMILSRSELWEQIFKYHLPHLAAVMPEQPPDSQQVVYGALIPWRGAPGLLYKAFMAYECAVRLSQVLKDLANTKYRCSEMPTFLHPQAVSHLPRRTEAWMASSWALSMDTQTREATFEWNACARRFLACGTSLDFIQRALHKSSTQLSDERVAGWMLNRLVNSYIKIVTSLSGIDPNFSLGPGGRRAESEDREERVTASD